MPHTEPSEPSLLTFAGTVGSGVGSLARAMQRVSTTVVALAGEAPSGLVDAVGKAANVRGVHPPADDEPLDRAVAAWREAVRSHIPYLVHDADPLGVVADAWERYYDETAPVGELEVGVQQTLTRWRARSIELPDYYLVAGAEDLPSTRRHWYLGFLHRRAPARVLPVDPVPEAVRARLGRLSAGRWWPDLDRLLDGVEHVVPDREGIPSTA
jgi:hypothetical protein